MERREADKIAVEKRADAGAPPAMTPLDPPNPAFAGGRKPKHSAYYSGRPGSARGAGPSASGYVAINGVGGGSVGSPESHGTSSGMSPGSGRGSGEDAAGAEPEGDVDCWYGGFHLIIRICRDALEFWERITCRSLDLVSDFVGRPCKIRV
jgi:hypothetical protein